MAKTPAISLMAYVDTSAILSIVFEEPDWEFTARRLAEFTVLLSSNLLEAEMRSAFEREGIAFDPGSISRIGWVNPTRSLGREMAEAVANGGYLKGADLWHIASALYVENSVPGNLAFFTLDDSQRAVAAKLGLKPEPARSEDLPAW